jgi:hypothetical protein
MMEFIWPLYNWLQQLTNHYLTQSPSSDWTLLAYNHTSLFHYSAVLRPLKKKVKIKVTLRLMVYRQISSSWRQAPWGSRPEIFFKLNSCCNSPYVTFSLMRRWVCLLWIRLAFRQVYVSRLQHVTENSFFCTVFKSSVSTVFENQIMRISRILFYNSSSVTWTVVSLTTAKFKPLIFSTSGFALCPLITPRHGHHWKHRLLLSKMHVYWPVT